MVDQRKVVQAVFGISPAVVGMVHLRPLPGCAGYTGSLAPVLAKALEEARTLRALGLDAVIIENMHDRPYLRREVGPEITAAMAVITAEIKAAVGCPVGVQVLAGANRAALAVALAAGAEFVRCEGFVFGHLADEGTFDSDAGELLRYRRAIGADHIRIFADIKKKHASHAISADTSIVDHAHSAEFFQADGLVITGRFTGEAADPAEVKVVHAAVEIPIAIGSGITTENVERYWGLADVLIVGSSLKQHGRWDQPLEEERIIRFMERIAALRQQR